MWSLQTPGRCRLLFWGVSISVQGAWVMSLSRPFCVSDMGERALPLQSMPIITLPHLLCMHYVLFTSLKPSESILKRLHAWNVCNYLLCETTYCGSLVRYWELGMRQLRDLKNNCLGRREVRSADPEQAQPHVPSQYHMTHQPPPDVAPPLEAREFWAVLEGNPISLPQKYF